MEERKALRCPLCGAAMTEGDVVCKIGAGPTLYPRVPVESEGKHLRKMFFGSRDAISAPELEGGWYCPACDRVLVLWKRKGTRA